MATFNTEFEIYFEDISPSGIVHLEKLAEWMSMGRERFFRATCPNHLQFVEQDVSMFTVQMSISVLGSSGWADKIKAIISMTKIKKISFEIHFDFLNERTNEVIAQGIQKVAFVREASEAFAKIPKDIDGAIRNYEKV